MSSTIWTPEATALRCPRCGASPGARCRTWDGRRTSSPHVGRLVPSFTCPLCSTVTTDPTNVASGYCTSCRDWTNRRAAPDHAGLTAAQDVLAW